MKFIANHLNHHLMIHFEEMVHNALLEIFKLPEMENPVYESEIKNLDFINLPFAVESGSYIIKIKTSNKSESKHILIK
ncbi:MAG: hypothetical protein JXR34_13200 [Bacteroidales bacterium]|nr:hypothetical protein [Bacteroidales bacterium]